jgi:hypothetical protein
MLLDIPDPLKDLLPSVISTTPATEDQESPQAMQVEEVTRSIDEEVLPQDRVLEVEPVKDMADQNIEKEEEEQSIERQDQLPTPSPSSHSTFSSVKPAAPQSSSSSSSLANTLLKRSTSRASIRGKEEDETKGWDGKEYQLCGMYYSHGITPKNPSLSRTTHSTPSTPRARRSTATSYSWRTIEPSKETILPPPIHYGLMLLGEAPETYRKLEDPDSEDEDEDDDEEEEEDSGPDCDFKLPFDILRDFYYAEDAAVLGKGGHRDEPTEDVEKRESSRKPAPYRHLQTS